MSTTTTNFGWTVPSDTDLVKDGAAAIRTALGGVDTSFVDLKGGTTGQVLSKASGTDLDFTWVAQDDSNAIQNAIVDAKGDLIVGASADTPARLAVGTNGYVLTANSSATNGVEWAAPAGGGKILQVVQGSSTTETTSTSGTYSDSTLSASITPSSTSSKILVFVNQYTSSESTNAEYGTGIAIVRNSTVIYDQNGLTGSGVYVFINGNTAQKNWSGYLNMTYLDSPATTSAITYKTQQKVYVGTSKTQWYGNKSTITLMEVGA